MQSAQNVTFQSHHQRLLCSEPSGRAVADRDYAPDNPGPWEAFAVEAVDGEHIAIRSHQGFYLRAEGGGGSTVDFRDTGGGPGPWEMWKVEPQENGTIALRAHNGIHYLCAELGGFVIANRTDVGPWEQWTVTPRGWVDGRVGPSQVAGRLRVEANKRWFANDAGRFDWREVSAFALYGLWISGRQDEARAYMRAMRGARFNVLRVLFTLDGEFWASHRVGPHVPGFWERLEEFYATAAQYGFYVRACMLGALEPFGGVWDPIGRRDIFSGEVQRLAEEFCVEFARRTDHLINNVLEQANEPGQIGMRDSFQKLVNLGFRVKAAAPQTLLCGGSVDGTNDDDITFLCEPFDFCDSHIERRSGVQWFEWIKRSYAVIDQPSADPHTGAGIPIKKRMPYVSGEPVNMGEGRAGDRTDSLAVAFAYGAMSRVRKFSVCFHYHGGLKCTLPAPHTVAMMEAFHRGLDAVPQLTDNLWRGHWTESFFRRDIYPDSDDVREVEAHVRAGRGPWRVTGIGAHYAVTIAEPGWWNYQNGVKAGNTVEVVDRQVWGEMASGVYIRR